MPQLSPPEQSRRDGPPQCYPEAMISTSWLVWTVLAACAAPVLLGGVALAFRQPLNVDAFISTLTKRIRTGEVARARKLANAVEQLASVEEQRLEQEASSGLPR